MTRRTRRNFLIAGSAGTALALAGAGAFFAAPSVALPGWGHRAHAGGWAFGHHRRFRAHGGAHDPEHVRAHLRRGVAWVLSEVDASPEQVEAVTGIFESALTELHGMREAHGAQREAFAEALSAAEIDRDALEALRAEGIAMAERASTLFVTAFADAAEVLTPGQREELMRLHDAFHGPHS